MTLRRAARLRRQPWDLRLTSSTACLLLLPKPNHCKSRPTSKVSAVSLEACQWSLRSIPSPSLPTAAMMHGQMRTCHRSTSAVSDCVGYTPSSFLDARQRQPSTESDGVNIQICLILGSMETTYRYRCHGCLARILSKLGPTGRKRLKGKIFEYLVC